MDRKQVGQRKRHIWNVCILIFVICCVFGLVYKAQLADKFHRAVRITLMSEHKETGEIQLSEENPVVSETFLCRIPELKQLFISCEGKNLDKDATLILSVNDADTGESYFQKEEAVTKMVSSKEYKKIQMKLDKTLKNSQNKLYILTCALENAGDSVIRIQANRKYTLVAATAGMSGGSNNILYEMRYSNTRQILLLYYMLCGAIILLAIMGYLFIIVKKMPVHRFYVPMAICLGIVMNVVVMIHGVPDEPNHLDTAYKLSNRLLLVRDTDVKGNLLKRACDVELEDMLANGVESNSYYQLYYHTFERPENTDLVEVSYADSSNLVPNIVFLPAAIGISIGRVLGLSAILTLGLGRLCNLLTFVCLVGLAIRMIPYGKNMMAFVGFLPITIQQAASASYDAVVNGLLLLFVAFSIRFSREHPGKKWQVVIYILLAIMVAMMKGGAYIPILLLLLLYRESEHVQEKKPVNKWMIVLSAFLICVVIGVLLVKYLPVITSLFAGIESGNHTMFSLGYIVKHPFQVVTMYWNTIMDAGDSHLRGLLGGLLSWQDVKIKWMFLCILLGGLLLFPNVENDRYIASGKEKRIMMTAFNMSVAVIMFSMLLGFTTIDQTHIIGVQGRYYIGIVPLLLLCSTNSMVKVNEQQCRKIWMTMLLVELFIVLQFVVEVM